MHLSSATHPDPAGLVTALNGMLTWMTEIYGISRNEALALATLVVDLRITQVANGVRGVHAVLHNGAIRTRS